jgi:hypothetical protein
VRPCSALRSEGGNTRAPTQHPLHCSCTSENWHMKFHSHNCGQMAELSESLKRCTPSSNTLKHSCSFSSSFSKRCKRD